MLLFKCGLFIIPSSYIMMLCTQIASETKAFDAGLVVMNIASVAIAGKIVHDRYQHIHILGSLTPNPAVTSFANNIASLSAASMFTGFLVHMCLIPFKVMVVNLAAPGAVQAKVDSYSLAAIDIFVCAFGTLYMWMQGIVTIYVSSLFYDKNLTALRQCLVSLSSLVLVVMATMGTIAVFLPKGTISFSGSQICLQITSACSFIQAAAFGAFVLSFEKDYKCFAQGGRTLLDPACSYNDVSTFTETNSLFVEQTADLQSSAIVIRGTINSSKYS